MDEFNYSVNRIGTNSKKWNSCEAKFGSGDVIPMWIADMDFPVPEPVVSAIESRASHGIFGYTAMPDSYLDAVASWMEGRHHWKVEKEWICHSPGVVSALRLLVEAFTEPGDQIIIQSPVHPPFERVIRMSGRTVLNNPLIIKDGKYQMDMEHLKVSVSEKVKMMFLCSPYNPVGRVWTKNELEGLADFCLKHNILVVADEIHGDLLYKGICHTCFPTLSSEIEQHTVLCTGASKTFNLAGLKTSSIIIPNLELRKQFQTLLDSYNLGAGNVFGLVATEAAYRYGEPWLEKLDRYLQGNLEYMIRFLQERIPQIHVIPPEGTYLVWMDFRELGMTDCELEAFCLREAKVAFEPGYQFGEGGSGFMRANIACPAKLLQIALENLERSVKTREDERIKTLSYNKKRKTKAENVITKA